MSQKILIALQYWAGDSKLALKLAKFLADIEPRHSDQADFLLLSRYDCPLDTTTVQHLSRKFNVHGFRGWKRGTGWPAGCNDLWLTVMEWAASMSQAKKIPEYKAIFTCEADGAPLFRDWITRMHEAWDQVSREKPVVVAGPLVLPGPHINGNCLVNGSPKNLNWLAHGMPSVHPAVGWDYLLAPLLKKAGWANIPGMRSIYNTPTFSAERRKSLQEEGVFWVHGGKDDSLIRLGREEWTI